VNGSTELVSEQQTVTEHAAEGAKQAFATPSAARLIEEHGLNRSAIEASGSGNRILKEDVLRVLKQRAEAPPAPVPEAMAEPAAAAPAVQTLDVHERPEKRVPMTRLRARIAERLLEAQQNAAILTTFNEVNMQPVMDLRSRYRENFEKNYGIKLGFMSFFVKAVIEALRRFPELNASIDGTDIVYHGFFDIGIAVSSPRGLVVPILRDTDQLSMADIETRINEFAGKARDGTLAMEDITGGTFTITNGGVFGSLLSTPILNPPQSGILGMHTIQQRPVAENGEVVIRPMMNIALSYDHRLVDGREAVQFLVTIKNVLEDPARMLLGV
jgi:2-oxoglutarate dehydrogenase E2 component (dihydrolipoamide succinyltransferase)